MESGMMLYLYVITIMRLGCIGIGCIVWYRISLSYHIHTILSHGAFLS